MHVRHDVVAELLFVVGDHREIDVVEVRSHPGNRRIGDIDAQRLLSLCQRQPKATPEPVSLLRTPQGEHGARRVAVGERGLVRRSIGSGHGFEK
jgi:hypothetical protein